MVCHTTQEQKTKNWNHTTKFSCFLCQNITMIKLVNYSTKLITMNCLPYFSGKKIKNFYWIFAENKKNKKKLTISDVK